MGTSDIYVIAETTDPTTGKAQKKQAYVSVKSVTLSLSCGYNLAATHPERRLRVPMIPRVYPTP